MNNEYYGPVAFTARRVAFEPEDVLRRGKIIAPVGLLRGYPNRVTAQFLRSQAQTLVNAQATCPEPFRSRLDRDIRYLEGAAKYMDFVLPYEAAVNAAKQRPPGTQEISNLRQLLAAWLDNQEELVRSGLKGHGYLDNCIDRDKGKIDEWLDKYSSPSINSPTQK